MTFNQELITKARKGEIAILNDGSVEEIRKVCREIKVDEFYANGKHKYYMLIDGVWNGSHHITDETYCSVKDFIMKDTKEHIVDTSIASGYPIIDGNKWSEMFGERPRTYRVTRQQMKEIWLLTNSTSLRNLVEKHFDCFDDVVDLSLEEVKWLVDHFLGDEPQKLFKSIFPEYFFIPEGQPVLVRQDDSMNWVIRISNGTGGAYSMGYLSGKSEEWKQIIPFTKNPPK